MNRDVRNFLVIAVALIVVVTLAGLLSRCVVGERTEQAVALDAAQASADGYQRGLEAERAATANEMAAAEIFANQQQELKEVAREADNGAGVGPATSAVLERMRQQQAKGRRGNATR